jgi:hypothetical protein
MVSTITMTGMMSLEVVVVVAEEFGVSCGRK